MDYAEKTGPEKSQLLLDQLRQHDLVVNAVNKKRRTRHQFRVQTKNHGEHKICHNCWALSHGPISKNRMKSAFKNLRAGIHHVPSTHNRDDNGLVGKFSTAAWVEGFGRRLGDSMPNSDAVQLPLKSHSEAYQVYLDAFIDDRWEKTLGRSAFYKVMRNLSRKHFARVLKAFLQCTMCHYLDTKIAKNVRKRAGEVFKQLKDIHRGHVGCMKRKYYKHRDKGKHPSSNPHWLSVIVDG